MSLPPGERVPLNAIGDAAFMREATPLLKSLARLSEVTVFADDAGFADASSDSPVAVVGATRLALHVEDRSRRRDGAPDQGDRSPRRRDRQGDRQARQRELRRPRAGGGGRSGEEARRRLHGDSESASRSASAPGIVDLKSARRRRRRLEQLVDAPRHRPGAALARLARRRGDARRHLQRLDAVQRPVRVERAGLDAVEPGRGDAAALQRRRRARPRRTGANAPC